MTPAWKKIQQWLQRKPSERRLEISHGGRGGKWYAALIDEHGDTVSNAAHDTPDEAASEAYYNLTGWCESGADVRRMLRETSAAESSRKEPQ